jgi:hypothetical protein
MSPPTAASPAAFPPRFTVVTRSLTGRVEGLSGAGHRSRQSLPGEKTGTNRRAAGAHFSTTGSISRIKSVA